jgi:hypothetical protein
MSSCAARKRVLKLAYENDHGFTQVSATRKRPKIQQDLPQPRATRSAPTQPLFTFTHTMRESLPTDFFEIQSTTVHSAPDKVQPPPDSHVLDDEEGRLRTPASSKVLYYTSCLMFTHPCAQGQNEMMNDWLNSSAQSFLLNTLRSESIFEQGQTCAQCEMQYNPIFQCRDCLHQWGRCAPCLRDTHQSLPSHQYRKWVGTHFENAQSSDLGYVFQLGHTGKPCDMGFECTFVLGDINGLHNITVRFCCHPGHGSPAKQLMDANIFPCSDTRPQTGFTFNVLRLFSFMSAESKLSAQRFYNVLVCLTNSTFPQDVPDRYREFMRAVRQWQWIQTVKHSGSTSLSPSSNADLQGDLVLRCPACPHEGINFEQMDVCSGDE